MREEKVLHSATISFIVRKNEVVLAIKTDKIGKDCRNGYGGGIKKGETSKQGAIRELEEESTIIVPEGGIERVAVIDFHNTMTDGSAFVCRCHIYLVRKWEGAPKETEEMLDPRWYDINNLPFDEMMLADPHWVPAVLNGKKIIAKAKYGPFQKTLRGKVELKEVDHLPDR